MRQFPDKPYERLKDEKKTEFSLFIKYRDTDPRERNIEALAKKTRKKASDVYEIASRNKWVERLRAWDYDTDRAQKLAKLKTIEKMKERHMEMGAAFQDLALRELTKLARVVEENVDEMVMTPSDIIRMGEMGIKLERLSSDEPTEISENRDGEKIDLSKLGVDDLIVLKRIKGTLDEPK